MDKQMDLDGNNSIKLRMDFMYNDEICSIIDVDFKNQKVYVKNITADY